MSIIFHPNTFTKSFLFQGPIHEPEPSETSWYVSHEKEYFKITVDPVNEMLLRMNIVFGNLSRRGLTPEPVEIAGIRFFVFREASGSFAAATLVP